MTTAITTRALGVDCVCEFRFVLGVPRFAGALHGTMNPIVIR